MPSIFGKPGSTAGRAKTRHKSIRGTISAPIPIPRSPEDDEFPIRNPGSAKASMTADDEFPIRTPGAGIAIPLPPSDGPGSSPDEPLEPPGEREHRDQQDQQPRDREPSPGSSTEREQEQETAQHVAPTGAPASISGGSGGSRTDLARETRPEPPSTPPPAPPIPVAHPASRPTSRPTSRSPPFRPSPRKTSPLAVSPSRVAPPERRATNPVLSTIRYSVVSDAPSKQTAQSRDSPQRKKSTLRSALGRLFGRGKKKPSSGSQDASVGLVREPRPLLSAQHRSDPTALGRPNQRSPKRSNSLPLSEFDRPLRSHSIGPDDIMAIESARNSLQAEAGGLGSGAAAGRRRAATTGGHTLLRPHLFNREFGAGLSPRPASTQGRASRTGARAESDDPNEIGRAITSDSGGGLRRRSRSLSGLQDFAGIQPGGRRRSDEIRYWRASYDPGFMSPLSSNAQDDVDDTGMVDTSIPGSPAVERPPKTPPQPFNFGLLSKEMIGMKITHAADMDSRLDNLETRSLHLEHVVDKLCHAVPGFTESANLREPAQAGIPQRSLGTGTQPQSSDPDFPPNPLSLHPPLPPTTTKPSSPPTPATSPPRLTLNPTSSTVRGASSLPTLGREATPQTDLVAQLRTDLAAERAARQMLEAQVKKLSERVNTLSTTMFAMVRGPSESRSQERLAATAAAAAAGAGSPSGAAGKTLLVPPVPSLSQEQLSVFETDDDDDDEDEDVEEEGEEGAGGRSKKLQGSSSVKTDLEEEDDFQTPREERTPMTSYAAFGEELGVAIAGPGGENEGVVGVEDDDDPKRKKAARTLSLGQLTLGKGQRARV